jgi:hypothetical protein
MARLKLYTVHLRTWSAAPDRDAVLVREGFCWPAFFFSFLWALRHRMWVAAAGLLALALGLAVLDDLLGPGGLASEALGLAAATLVGFEANDWRRGELRRRGYAEAGIVAASDRESAEHQFFARRASQPA